jgi:3-methyladenine DNA glycosylase AlkD
MTGADRALIGELRQELRAIADPSRAPRMQAYMKSRMPYLGVPSRGVKEVCREVFGRHTLTSFRDWTSTVRALWREAGAREERYAAIALTGVGAYREHQTPAAVPLYEELVTTGAWWDYVDEVAVRRIGPMLLSHPDSLRPLMLDWSTSPDMWKRRTAIICQVAAKKRTDLELLYACIEPNTGDREFFIRKAIGWALRAHAWTDPAAVAVYVERNAARLSGLSRREALKNIRSQGSV